MIYPVTVPEGTRGLWTVSRFEVPASSISTIGFALKGRDILPGVYTRLTHAHRGVVMSDTTAERRDHYGFVCAARGHVLINGLGIGMCLDAVLRKAEVTAATVVEMDADVIALVGPHYMRDPRVQIVHLSAFDYRPPAGLRYGAVWHDIWDSICADNLPEMHRLHRKYGRRTDWQGSWCRWQCERARR